MDAIITAAGKNSRMINDFQKKNKTPIHKLKLELNNKPIIINTIEKVLESNVDKCIISLGYFKEEIYNTIEKFGLIDNVCININKKVDVSLCKTIQNVLETYDYNNYYVYMAADQPTIEVDTINNLINTTCENNNPQNTLSILARDQSGKLDNAKGIGMPFCCKGALLYKYLKDKNSNLNPILQEMVADNVNFYGIEAKNNLELININHYNDYVYIKNILKRK